MGSEQSTSQNSNSIGNNIPRHPNSRNESKLQRGHTIADPGNNSGNIQDSSPTFHSSSRPVSPPMSVCSDSDLPYISYTDRPIGDSPKLRNKSQVVSRNPRLNNNVTKRQYVAKKAKSTAHNVVVVNAATKEAGMEFNAEIMRLKVDN